MTDLTSVLREMRISVDAPAAQLHDWADRIQHALAPAQEGEAVAFALNMGAAGETLLWMDDWREDYKYHARKLYTAPPAVPGWRPIEEAADKTRIIGYWPKGDPQIETIYFDREFYMDVCDMPTHFQPLPQPPEPSNG